MVGERDKPGNMKWLKGRIAELETLVSEYEQSEETLRNALRKEYDDREKAIEEQTAHLIATNAQLLQEIADRKKAEDALHFRVEFERLITALSTSFINCAPDEVDGAIHTALKTIGEFVSVDRSYVFLFVDQGTTISDTYEWRAQGITPQIEHLKGHSIDDEFPWLAKKLRRRGVFHVSSYDELPADANAEKEYLQFNGIQSLIAVPMFCGRSFIGFAGFDSVRSKKTWEVDIIALLRIMGEIFASALERKWFEIALREKENRYRLLFECSSDGIAAVDPEGRIHDCNKAFKNILGRSHEDILGKKVSSFYDEGQKRLFLQGLLRAQREGRSESELQLRRADETVVPIWCKANAMYDEFGHIRRILLHCRDMTGRQSGEDIMGGSVQGPAGMTKCPSRAEDAEEIGSDHGGFLFGKKGMSKRGGHNFAIFKQIPKKIANNPCFKDILSKSQKIWQFFDILPSVAESVSTVLIQGESGTGKHLFAQAIHNLSPRREKPLIVVNCGALPDTLLESELFGYKAGAFTDAKRDKPGRFALADGGTLFLDEIGDISPAMQVRLLRFLQERVYEPLGSVNSFKADVRIIAATNKNLLGLVKEGKFREDLFYRINVVRLDLPPLRERLEDVPLLVEHFIATLNTQRKKNVTGIHEDALICLLSYGFPGNIRELENIIERAFVLCGSGCIERRHLPEAVCTGVKVDCTGISNQTVFMKMEAALLMNILNQNNWNKMETARQLGIHKSTLFRKIKSLGLTLPPHSKGSKD